MAITFGEPVGTTIAGWCLLMENSEKNIEDLEVPPWIGNLPLSLYIYTILYGCACIS